MDASNRRLDTLLQARSRTDLLHSVQLLTPGPLRPSFQNEHSQRERSLCCQPCMARLELVHLVYVSVGRTLMGAQTASAVHNRSQPAEHLAQVFILHGSGVEVQMLLNDLP